MSGILNVWKGDNPPAGDCPVRLAAKVWAAVSADRGSTQAELRAAQRAYRAATGATAWKPPKAYKWCPCRNGFSAGGWYRETAKPMREREAE